MQETCCLSAAEEKRGDLEVDTDARQLASQTLESIHENSPHQMLFSDLQSGVNWQWAGGCRPRHMIHTLIQGHFGQIPFTGLLTALCLTAFHFWLQIHSPMFPCPGSSICITEWLSNKHNTCMKAELQSLIKPQTVSFQLVCLSAGCCTWHNTERANCDFFFYIESGREWEECRVSWTQQLQWL